jgi:hypothetical protein
MAMFSLMLIMEFLMLVDLALALLLWLRWRGERKSLMRVWFYMYERVSILVGGRFGEMNLMSRVLVIRSK